MKKICNPASTFCLKIGLPWEDFLFKLTQWCPGRELFLESGPLANLADSAPNIGVDLDGNV